MRSGGWSLIWVGPEGTSLTGRRVLPAFAFATALMVRSSVGPVPDEELALGVRTTLQRMGAAMGSIEDP